MDEAEFVFTEFCDGLNRFVAETERDVSDHGCH
jgi:hypothetical protein